MPASPGTKPLKPLKPGMGLYQVFHWPDKAPDKSKPWAVVNLQTRDINGRWHATREEALAQARAMYSTMGDKAKVHTEDGLRNAYFFAADSATLVDGTEDGVKWIEAIAPKTYTTPAYGDVVITSGKIDNFIHNLNNGVRGQDVAIDYEHGLDPAKGKKAAGWIRGARKNANGNLELAVDFTETAKEEIAKKEWKYFSLEWDDSWQHPDGVLFNDVVMGGALTNRPVAKGLIPVNFSEIFAETSDSDYEFAVWSTAYVNSLPDSCFAWIEPGGTKTDGKTDPAHRHLPYKDANGKIDLAHVRNMMARASQVSGIPSAVVSKVMAMGKRMLGANSMSELIELDKEFSEEQAAWARSDPGIGVPIYGPERDGQPDPGTAHFIPRQPGDPNDDKAIAGGWRRTTPPIAEDVFKFTEEQAIEYLTSSAKAFSMYVDEEPTADDIVTARGLLASITGFIDQDTKKYSEYTDLCLKVKKFFEKKSLEDKNSTSVRMEFTEQEAIGYLTSAKRGLDRIHTNAGNALIDRIDAMLAQDFRKRSFNELQTLVSETRSMLRGEGDDVDTKPSVTSTTTTPLKGGNTVGELTEKDLRELRNVLDVDDDGKILEAVQHRFGELAALRDAVSASEQERVFAEQYPQFYAEHQRMMAESRRHTAKAFTESVQSLRKNEGFGLKQTKLGLSTAANEMISEAHVKFSENRGTLEDFENVIKGIMHGGLVQFGEIGTGNEEAIPEVDGNSAVGIAQARRLFAEQVAKYQRENPDVDMRTATAEVAKKHPDLAELYKVTLPA